MSYNLKKRLVFSCIFLIIAFSFNLFLDYFFRKSELSLLKTFSVVFGVTLGFFWLDMIIIKLKKYYIFFFKSNK
jgi:hypothetical protein